MEESFKEFDDRLKRRREPKIAKVRNSYGVYDAYVTIRKNKWEGIGKHVSSHDFYAVIRGVNKLLAKNLGEGKKISFPHGMGTLEIRKSERGAYLVGGQLKVSYPIDWKSTFQLWYEDKEANKRKILIRNEERWVYSIKYSKHDANYPNQYFYQFVVNRLIKKALKDNIKQGKIDTLYGERNSIYKH